MSTPSTGWSSVGKKMVSGLTGLGLVGFVVVHLAGNLLLMVGAEPFNSYANFLGTVGHGALLPFAEVGLLLLFMLHIGSGFTVFNDKGKARPQGYVRVADAGGKSRKTMSSKSMIVTGTLLTFFVVLHVLQFRLGAGLAEGYSTHIDGVSRPVRDLYTLVLQTFHNPMYVVIYVVSMILLGVHLRHGFWSMFQSIGWNTRRTPWLYPLGILVGLVLAIGFIALPLYMYSQPLLSAAPGGTP